MRLHASNKNHGWPHLNKLLGAPAQRSVHEHANHPLCGDICGAGGRRKVGLHPAAGHQWVRVQGQVRVRPGHPVVSFAHGPTAWRHSDSSSPTRHSLKLAAGAAGGGGSTAPLVIQAGRSCGNLQTSFSRCVALNGRLAHPIGSLRALGSAAALPYACSGCNRRCGAAHIYTIHSNRAQNTKIEPASRAVQRAAWVGVPPAARTRGPPPTGQAACTS